MRPFYISKNRYGFYSVCFVNQTTGKKTPWKSTHSADYSEAMMLAKGCGARVIGIAAIIDRSTENLNFNVPVRSLLSYPLQLFHSSSCPLCAQNIPLSVPGLGKLPDNMMR